MPDGSRPVAYAPSTRIAIALAVIDHWSTCIMSHGDLQVDWRAAAHPLALVGAALEGETDPMELGIDPNVGDHFDAIQSLVDVAAAGSFVLSIRGCARCDGDGHENVTWLPLDHPIEEDDGTIWSYWAPCPTNGQPVFMRSFTPGARDAS